MPTIEEFGKKIKEKYPQYSNVNDRELGQKFLEKHPEYSDRVFDTDPNEQAKISGDEPGGVTGALKRGWEGLKESLGKRLDNTGQIMNSNQGKLSKVLQVAGQGFGTIGDTIGAGVTTAASAITPDEAEKKIKSGFQKGVQKVLDTDTAKSIIERYKKFKEAHPEAAGNVEAAGNILDAFLNATGAGAGAKGAKITAEEALKVGGKAAMPILKGTVEFGKKTGKLAGSLVETATSMGTGMERSTIQQILKNPERFSSKAMEGVDRESMFGKVKDAIDKRLEQLSETGKGYDAIRKNGEVVTIKENPVKKILNKYGIDIDDEGKVVMNAESVPLGSGDVREIQNFVKQYIPQDGNMTANAFLNARKALSNMAKYAEDKTDMAGKIAREIRKELDTAGKGTLTGLRDLDAKFSSEIKLLEKAKKAIYNRDGTLKNNAVSVIANLAGKGKEQLLEKIEQIVPGITKDLDVMKAIEDIDISKGKKVGNYTRSIVAGAGAVSGNLPALIGAIASSPQVAVPVLRGVAKGKQGLKEMLSKLGKKGNPNTINGETIRLQQKSETTKLKERIDKIKESAKKKVQNDVKPFEATVYRGKINGENDGNIGQFYSTEKDRAEFYKSYKESKVGKSGSVEEKKIKFEKPLMISDEHLDAFEELKGKIPGLKKILSDLYADEAGNLTDSLLVKGEKLIQKYAKENGYDGVVFGKGSIIIDLKK